LKVLAHTIGQLIPLYITTKSRVLLCTLLDEVIRKYKERILKLILNAFDVQTRSICKIYPQYVDSRNWKSIFHLFSSRNGRFQADYGFLYMTKIVIASNEIQIEEETDKLIVRYDGNTSNKSDVYLLCSY
jgi:hypothetical protein